MSSFSIDLPASLRESYAGTVAALPATFRGSEREIVVIDGVRPDWTRLARTEVVGAVLANPFEIAAMPELAIPVAVDLPWSGSPVGRTGLLPEPENLTIVELVFVLAESDPRPLWAALADLLIVLLRAVPGEVQISTRREAPDVLSATGSFGDAALSISGVRSAHAPGFGRIILRGVERVHDVRFAPPGASQPGAWLRADLTGEWIAPPVHSDSHRTTVLELVDAIEDGGMPADLALLRKAAEIACPAPQR
jgi:hypothetical protein